MNLGVSAPVGRGVFEQGARSFVLGKQPVENDAGLREGITIPPSLVRASLPRLLAAISLRPSYVMK